MEKTLPTYNPEVEYWCMCDKKGKTWNGAPKIEEVIWEVELKKGDFFTAKTQFEAEVMMRLQRIENLLKQNEK